VTLWSPAAKIAGLDPALSPPSLPHCPWPQHNPLLHDVFEFQPQAEAGERMSKTERRLFKSPNSAAARGRQKNRGSERAAAAANRHSLLGESW